MINNEVGKRIRALRQKKSINQTVMGRRLGLSQTNYRRLELDDSRIDVNRLFLIAEILETTTTWLLHGVHNENALPSHLKIIETSEQTIITISK